MTSINPPFTSFYGFTGPPVAISCDVEWDAENEEYVATSSVGFKGTSRDSAQQAALACFAAWVGGPRGWFTPNKEAE